MYIEAMEGRVVGGGRSMEQSGDYRKRRNEGMKPIGADADVMSRSREAWH
jgi:hypothetical protein